MFCWLPIGSHLFLWWITLACAQLLSPIWFVRLSRRFSHILFWKTNLRSYNGCRFFSVLLDASCCLTPIWLICSTAVSSVSRTPHILWAKASTKILISSWFSTFIFFCQHWFSCPFSLFTRVVWLPISNSTSTSKSSQWCILLFRCYSISTHFRESVLPKLEWYWTSIRSLLSSWLALFITNRWEACRSFLMFWYFWRWLFLMGRRFLG